MNTMTIGEYFKRLKQQLTEILDASEVDSHLRIISEHFLKMNRAERQLSVNQPIDLKVMGQIDSVLDELKQNRPLGYIIKESNFMGYSLYVDESVLIPRSETEELVMLVIEHEASSPESLLDIGTGSGCIPIALAKDFPNTKIDAIDVSEGAVEVAKRNVAKHQVQVNVFQLNYLTDPIVQPYEVVVSNPPYVKLEEISDLENQVKEYEPIIALTPGEEPLLFYRKMLDDADKILKAGGRLYWEIHEDLGKEVLQLFEGRSFDEVKLFQDIYGRDRFVRAVFNP